MHYQDIEIEIYSDPINQKRYKPYTTGFLTISNNMATSEIKIWVIILLVSPLEGNS